MPPILPLPTVSGVDILGVVDAGQSLWLSFPYASNVIGKGFCPASVSKPKLPLWGNPYRMLGLGNNHIQYSLVNMEEDQGVGILRDA